MRFILGFHFRIWCFGGAADNLTCFHLLNWMAVWVTAVMLYDAAAAWMLQWRWDCRCMSCSARMRRWGDVGVANYRVYCFTLHSGREGGEEQPLCRDKKHNYTFIPSQLCPLLSQSLVAWWPDTSRDCGDQPFLHQDQGYCIPGELMKCKFLRIFYLCLVF